MSDPSGRKRVGSGSGQDDGRRNAYQLLNLAGRYGSFRASLKRPAKEIRKAVMLDSRPRILEPAAVTSRFVGIQFSWSWAGYAGKLKTVII